MIHEKKNILVIKLSALGDFIQALGPMAAIRHHHANDHITLLTTAPFVSIARETKYFDSILTDPRPRFLSPAGWATLIHHVRGGAYDRVYDLQNNDRTTLYHRIMTMGRKEKAEWVGTTQGASHRDVLSNKKIEDALTRHKRLLGLAGIEQVTFDDLSWIRSDPAHFGLPHPYVLLTPGSAPTRTEKRWPVESYEDLALHIAAAGFCPVVIGTLHEKDLGKAITKACSESIDLCGKTSLLDLVGLARSAAGAIGNDTGPMHLIAPTGCPSLVLFSRHSNPALHKPLGSQVLTLQADPMESLTPEQVMDHVRNNFFRHKGINKSALA